MKFEPSICPQAEVKDNPAVDFADRNYRYRLVATQISHNSGLAPIPYTGRKPTPGGDRINAASLCTSSKQYALNRVITWPDFR